MLRILVFGDGQLGTALRKVLETRSNIDLTVWAWPRYDMTNPRLTEQVAALRADVVINAAAWTNVDGAEANIDVVYATNALGPKYLAEACAASNALLVHVSTNEVFAGAPGRFYREYDQPAPSSIYAASKQAGETAVLTTWRHSMIVRVAWLFAPIGANFPAKIVAAADKHGSLRVVNDEFGNPTYAPDAAKAIVQLVERGRSGIYHLVNEGSASRYDFARAVLEQSGRSHIPLTPIPASEWPRPTTPPAHAVLVNQAAAALGITLRPWQEAVVEWATDNFRTNEVS